MLTACDPYLLDYYDSRPCNMHAPECRDADTCAIRVRHSDHMLHECSSVHRANIFGARTWAGRPGQDYLRPQRRDCTCALALPISPSGQKAKSAKVSGTSA